MWGGDCGLLPLIIRIARALGPEAGWGDLAAPPASKDRICTHSNGKGREGGWGRYGMDWYGLGSIA